MDLPFDLPFEDLPFPFENPCDCFPLKLPLLFMRCQFQRNWRREVRLLHSQDNGPIWTRFLLSCIPRNRGNLDPKHSITKYVFGELVEWIQCQPMQPMLGFVPGSHA